MAKRKKIKIIFVTVFLVILFFVAISGTSFFWLTSGELSPAKLEISKIVPVPAALVNNHPILMRDYFERLQKIQSLGSQKTSQEVLGQMLEEKKVELLANESGVWVKNSDIEAEFNIFISNFEKEKNQNFLDYLSKYGLNKDEFINFVFRPEVLLTKLNIWYNNNSNLNPEAFSKISLLKSKIEQGIDFGALATKYTEEQTEKQVEGDLGFVESKNLLPEIETELRNAKEGDVKYISSREGINIVKVEEIANSPIEGSQRMHLKRIFIRTGDFSSWLKEETKNYKVQIFLKI